MGSNDTRMSANANARSPIAFTMRGSANADMAGASASPSIPTISPPTSSNGENATSSSPAAPAIAVIPGPAASNPVANDFVNVPRGPISSFSTPPPTVATVPSSVANGPTTLPNSGPSSPTIDWISLMLARSSGMAAPPAISAAVSNSPPSCSRSPLMLSNLVLASSVAYPESATAFVHLLTPSAPSE